MSQGRPPNPIRLLPLEAARWLQEAAKEPDSLARRIAIEKATEKVRRKYPNFFKQEL